MVQAPKGNPHLTHYGEWNSEKSILTQYKWYLGLPLLESSTASLCKMQNTSIASSHVALQKWVTQLGSPLPEHIWQATWLPIDLTRKTPSSGRSHIVPLQLLGGASRISITRIRRFTAQDVTSICRRICFIAYGNAQSWPYVGIGVALSLPVQHIVNLRQPNCAPPTSWWLKIFPTHGMYRQSSGT